MKETKELIIKIWFESNQDWTKSR